MRTPKPLVRGPEECVCDCGCQAITRRPNRICNHCSKGQHPMKANELTALRGKYALQGREPKLEVIKKKPVQSKPQMFGRGKRLGKEPRIGSVIRGSSIPLGQLCTLCYRRRAVEGTVIGSRLISYRCEGCLGSEKKWAD